MRGKEGQLITYEDRTEIQKPTLKPSNYLGVIGSLSSIQPSAAFH